MSTPYSITRTGIKNNYQSDTRLKGYFLNEKNKFILTDGRNVFEEVKKLESYDNIRKYLLISNNDNQSCKIKYKLTRKELVDIYNRRRRMLNLREDDYLTETKTEEKTRNQTENLINIDDENNYFHKNEKNEIWMEYIKYNKLYEKNNRQEKFVDPFKNRIENIILNNNKDLEEKEIEYNLFLNKYQSSKVTGNNIKNIEKYHNNHVSNGNSKKIRKKDSKIARVEINLDKSSSEEEEEEKEKEGIYLNPKIINKGVLWSEINHDKRKIHIKDKLRKVRSEINININLSNKPNLTDSQDYISKSIVFSDRKYFNREANEYDYNDYVNYDSRQTARITDNAFSYVLSTVNKDTILNKEKNEILNTEEDDNPNFTIHSSIDNKENTLLNDDKKLEMRKDSFENINKDNYILNDHIHSCLNIENSEIFFKNQKYDHNQTLLQQQIKGKEEVEVKLNNLIIANCVNLDYFQIEKDDSFIKLKNEQMKMIENMQKVRLEQETKRENIKKGMYYIKEYQKKYNIDFDK